MNSILLLIILIPAIEIYLFIKIGSQIGAISTILLIFTTAVVGIYYAKYEGLNTLKSGFIQLNKNTCTYTKSADLLERRACEMPVKSSNPFQSTSQLINPGQPDQPASSSSQAC